MCIILYAYDILGHPGTVRGIPGHTSLSACAIFLGLTEANCSINYTHTSGMVHIVGERKSAHVKLEARITLRYVQCPSLIRGG